MWIGPGCRPPGASVPCTTSADCPEAQTFAQFCVDDPRDACDPNLGDTGCASHAIALTGEKEWVVLGFEPRAIDSNELGDGLGVGVVGAPLQA